LAQGIWKRNGRAFEALAKMVGIILEEAKP
jgi:hypothetical protein